MQLNFVLWLRLIVVIVDGVEADNGEQTVS